MSIGSRIFSCSRLVAPSGIFKVPEYDAMFSCDDEWLGAFLCQTLSCLSVLFYYPVH